MLQPIPQIINNTNSKINPYLKEVKDEYILIIDGNTLLKNSLAHKEYNDEGINIGAIYTFLWGIKKQLHKKNFSRIYLFWDGENSGLLRYQYLPEYKANRGKGYSEYDRNINAFIRQRIPDDNPGKKYANTIKEVQDRDFKLIKPIICDICEDLFIRQEQDKEGGTEADDMISYIVKNKKNNWKIIIITNDKDIYQLIQKDVVIYDLKSKEYIHQDNVNNKLGMPVENLLLYKMIKGDTSDNVKGVQGWGEQTIKKYIPEFFDKPITIEYISNKLYSLIKEQKKESKVLRDFLDCKDNGFLDNLDKILNLKHPLLTNDMEDRLNTLIEQPLSAEGRGFKNIIEIIKKYKIKEFYGDKFTNFFLIFKNVINYEENFYKNY